EVLTGFQRIASPFGNATGLHCIDTKHGRGLIQIFNNLRKNLLLRVSGKYIMLFYRWIENQWRSSIVIHQHAIKQGPQKFSLRHSTVSFCLIHCDPRYLGKIDIAPSDSLIRMCPAIIDDAAVGSVMDALCDTEEA